MVRYQANIRASSAMVDFTMEVVNATQIMGLGTYLSNMSLIFKDTPNQDEMKLAVGKAVRKESRASATISVIRYRCSRLLNIV